MKKNHKHNGGGSLVEDAGASLGVSARKVSGVRNQVATVLGSAGKVAGNVRNQVVAGAKKTDRAVREHPYRAAAVVLGLGALLGYALGARQSKKVSS
jgi:ElaB/YqjD/DUF883 family membrane-anchored ribosome-binding protein